MKVTFHATHSNLNRCRVADCGNLAKILEACPEWLKNIVPEDWRVSEVGDY
jgi:hypothetical protein